MEQTKSTTVTINAMHTVVLPSSFETVLRMHLWKFDDRPVPSGIEQQSRDQNYQRY